MQTQKDRCWNIVLALCPQFDALRLSEFLSVLAAANVVANQRDGGDAFELGFISNAGGGVRSSSMFSIDTSASADYVGNAHVAVFAGPADAQYWADPCGRLAAWAVAVAPRLISLGGAVDTSGDEIHAAPRRDRRAPIDLALRLVEDCLGVDARHQVAALSQQRMVDSVEAVPDAGRLPVARPGMRTEIASALNWVAEQGSSAFELEDMAEAASMSLRNFRRVFASELGMSPSEYLDRYRIDAARELLKTTSLPLKAVARRAGFPSERALRRAFAQLCAMSPTEYRNGPSSFDSG